MDHNSKDAVNRQCGSTPPCDIPLLLGRHPACCDPGRACTKNSNANDEHGRRSHCTHVTRIVYESHPSVSVEGIYTVPSRAENLAAHLRACLVANHSSSITVVILQHRRPLALQALAHGSPSAETSDQAPATATYVARNLYVAASVAEQREPEHQHSLPGKAKSAAWRRSCSSLARTGGGVAEAPVPHAHRSASKT